MATLQTTYGELSSYGNVEESEGNNNLNHGESEGNTGDDRQFLFQLYDNFKLMIWEGLQF